MTVTVTVTVTVTGTGTGTGTEYSLVLLPVSVWVDPVLEFRPLKTQHRRRLDTTR